jgi:predicted nuclease of predicted toxin-antitoxin system
MAVRFKLDENLPRDAAEFFQRSGHDTETVLDERLGGQLDATVFEACQREGRVLVTLDLDFSDIRRYPPAAHSGVWVLRPATQSVGSTIALLRGALDTLAREPAHQHLWIVEPERIRIRK